MRWDAQDEHTHIVESIEQGEFEMSYEEDHKKNNPITLNTPEQDARIGKRARTKDGTWEGVIESIIRHADGWECLQVTKGNITRGGILPGELIIEE